MSLMSLIRAMDVTSYGRKNDLRDHIILNLHTFHDFSQQTCVHCAIHDILLYPNVYMVLL